MSEEIILPLPSKNKRKKDEKYTYMGDIVIWNGVELKCKHDRRRTTCSICKKDKEEEFKDHEKYEEYKDLPELPRFNKDREKDKMYLYHHRPVIWGGKFIQCIHKKQIERCKNCLEIDEYSKKFKNGRCEHGKLIFNCDECGGSMRCKHSKQRSYCRECNGSAFCEHDKVKYDCVECGGNIRCKHGKRRRRCIECGGEEICKHKIEKENCHICDNHPDRWCIECKFVNIYKYGKPYGNWCFRCYCHLHPNEKIPRRFLMKENYIHTEIEKYFPNKFIHNKLIQDGNSKRRPDWYCDCDTYCLIIECDEEKHKHYDKLCDNRRLMELFLDCKSRPLIFIRFNPDKYIDENGIKHKSIFHFDIKNKISKYGEFDERIQKLIDTIRQNLIENFVPDKEITVIRLFFE